MGNEEFGMIIDLLKSIDNRMGFIEEKMDSIEKRMDSVETDIRDIKLTMENEINTSIRIIAEGHLDLSRKLDEALRVNQEKEFLLLRVTKLENQVRQINEKIGLQVI